MNKLEKAKEIIKEYYEEGRCGIFNSRNTLGDPMINIYDGGNFTIDICYRYSYFEVFGLSNREFAKLVKYYNKLS